MLVIGRFHLIMQKVHWWSKHLWPGVGVLPSVTTKAVFSFSHKSSTFQVPTAMETVDPSINLASAMPANTENNEKALPLEKAETVPEQQDLEPEPEPDFNLWQQVPVFIAMSLGIFIQGLVCYLFSTELT